MDKFEVHTGIVAPLLRDNIDTDTIIPSREMKTVSKTGLADGLFAAWRYLDEKARTPNSNFLLNHDAYQNMSILLAGNNFGCGSSREHAVWALKEYGVRCIIAESFGSIFFRNCVRNGILAISLERERINAIAQLIEPDPRDNPATIDLRQQVIAIGQRFKAEFKVTESDRQALLQGLDPIAATQKLQSKIDAFARHSRKTRPWL